MKDEVYIVTDGDYDDYHLIGVFSDKEKAQDFADRYNFGYKNTAIVETHKLDFMTDSVFQYHVIGINMDTGEIKSTHMYVSLIDEAEYFEYPNNYDWVDGKKEDESYTYREYYIPNREGMTTDKATKIVIEKRQRWLSEQ